MRLLYLPKYQTKKLMVYPRIKKIGESRNRSHDSVISILSKSKSNSKSLLSGMRINQYKSYKKNPNFNLVLGKLKVLRVAASSVDDADPDYEGLAGFNPGAKGIEFKQTKEGSGL